MGVYYFFFYFSYIYVYQFNTKDFLMKTRIEHLFWSLNDSETLTEEEGKWVNKMSEYYDEYGTLSEKQLNILEDIYKRDNSRR
jgi:hypothetical protein